MLLAFPGKLAVMASLHLLTALYTVFCSMRALHSILFKVRSIAIFRTPGPLSPIPDARRIVASQVTPRRTVGVSCLWAALDKLSRWPYSRKPL